MKILILTCSTGEGHNSAAAALHEHFERQCIESEVVDTLSLVNTAVSKAASDLYLFSTRTNIFRMLYAGGERVSNVLKDVQSPVYLANKLYCDRLYRYICQHRFDAVICVHLFPAEAITALRRLGKLQVKTLFVMTDYTCIPFLEETDLDYYIAPHAHLVEECVAKGIPRCKLKPFGIPVKHLFRERHDKAQARELCKSLFGASAVTTQPWMLVMSGSMGFGNVSTLVRRLCDEPTPKTIFVVCGNNKKLYASLNKQVAAFRQVVLIGFTDKIATLMDACDVIFTKPGGLSSTEAAIKGIPIVHTAPIPGCETRNALFFHYHGMSYSTADVDEQVRQALRLCTDSAARDAMLAAQAHTIRPDTCDAILSLL